MTKRGGDGTEFFYRRQPSEPSPHFSILQFAILVAYHGASACPPEEKFWHEGGTKGGFCTLHSKLCHARHAEAFARRRTCRAETSESADAVLKFKTPHFQRGLKARNVTSPGGRPGKIAKEISQALKARHILSAQPSSAAAAFSPFAAHVKFQICHSRFRTSRPPRPPIKTLPFSSRKRPSPNRRRSASAERRKHQIR